ncbi:MAG: apolipoprotein N-acyltransferase [Chthonomonadaceae bacterium]|nr:apolipoprotein N-acyltransferase [Chthonomonadaceae bacterium]
MHEAAAFGYNGRVNTLNSIITDAAPSSQEKLRKTFPKGQPGLRLALLAGLLLFLANPPFHLWPLAWVAVVPLIVSVNRAGRWRQAVWRGYLFGWAFLGPTWYWTALTITGWTEQPAVGLGAWFILTLILASYYGLWGGVTWWVSRRVTGHWRIVLPAALWVLMEWLRTVGATTMPWAQVSYTQYHFLPVLQIAEWTGAYGISFLILLLNAALAYRWMNRDKPDSGQPALGVVALIAFVCIFGVLRLSIPDTGRPLVVAAMQGNFKSNDAHETRAQEYLTFSELTREAYASSPRPSLYVWGESASPGDALTDDGTFTYLRTLARQVQAPVMVGTRVKEVRYARSHRIDIESNASVLFPADSSKPQRYNKQRLVPYGEFIPLRALIPPQLDDSLQIPVNDVTPGSEATVFRFQAPQAGEVALGPFICYESMYPLYARSAVRNGANLLVTQSNDDWFKSEAAMEQHVAAVVLRAVETRRQVVRSTTTGITCFIDSHGAITQRAPINAKAVLKQTVILREGRTLYVLLGDWFVLACAVLVAFALWKHQATPPTKPRKEGDVA